MNLKFEKWISSENQTEVHFFIEGTSVYVFGFNPMIVPTEVVDLILDKLKDIDFGGS